MSRRELHSLNKNENDSNTPLINSEISLEVGDLQKSPSSGRTSARVGVSSLGGKLVTAGAMFGQGSLAWLLIEAISMNTGDAYIPLAIGGGGIVAFCAFMGKYYLVTFFNHTQWEALGRKSATKFLLDLTPLTWKWSDKHEIFHHLKPD